MNAVSATGRVAAVPRQSASSEWKSLLQNNSHFPTRKGKHSAPLDGGICNVLPLAIAECYS
jgi:hypothetical protein